MKTKNTTTINLSKPCKLPFEGAVRLTQYQGEDKELLVELKDDVLYIGGQPLEYYLCDFQIEYPYPTGYEVLKELKKKRKLLPAIIGDFLVEHPEFYPKSLKRKLLHFFEDIFKDPTNNDLYVHCIYWYDNLVVLDYYWIGIKWGPENLSGSLTE